MFEAIVSKILVRVLGDYIEGLDRNSLKIGLLHGNVEMHNLKMKSTALDAFDLPVTVVWGYVGTIKASIPWKTIGSSPVTINVEDIYLVVQPRRCVPYDEKLEKERIEKARVAKLHTYDLSSLAKDIKPVEQTSSSASSSDSGDKNDTFVNRLVETIVSNLQIRIKNVRLRYEDDYDASNPIIFGADVSSIEAVSCNEDWQEAFIKVFEKPMFKKASITDVYVYSEPVAQGLYSKINSLLEFKEQMEKPRADLQTCILPATEAILKIILQREGAMDMKRPKLLAELNSGRLMLEIDDKQYKNVLKTLEYISNYSKFENYRSLRPAKLFAERDRMSSASKRKLWWKYLIGSANKKLRKQYFTWREVEQKKRNREEYSDLYKRSKGYAFLKKLESDEAHRLHELEKLMPTVDVLYVRSIAEAELRIELQNYEKYQSTQKQETKGISGWISSWFTGAQQLDERAMQEIQLTDSQRKELEQQIGYDAQEIAQSASAPPEYIKFLINVLFSGQIQLRDTESNKVLIQGSLENLHTSVGIRENSSVIVNTTLETISLVDMFTPDSKYPHIISHRASGTQLVDVTVETNPVHSSSDLLIDAEIGGIDVFVNLKLMQRILSFFIVPSYINLQELQSAAVDQLVSLQQQAITQLQIALEQKYAVDINLNIVAPTFIIPEDPLSVTRPIVVANLGHLTFKSEGTNAERRIRLKENKLQQQDFYDDFSLELSEMSGAIYLNHARMEQLHPDDQIVDNISLSIKFSYCLAKSPQYPDFLLDGSLPAVHLTFSPKKLKRVSAIINNVIDFIENPTSTPKSSIIRSSMVHLKSTASAALLPPDQDYWCDLRTDGVLFFYKDADTRVKPVATIEVNHLTGLANSSLHHDLKRNEISMQIPFGKDKITFTLGLPDSTKADQWYNALNGMILAIIGEKQEQQVTRQKEANVPSVLENTDARGKEVRFKARFAIDKFEVSMFYSKDLNTEDEDFLLAKLFFDGFSFDLTSRNFDHLITIGLKKGTVTEYSTGQPRPVISSGYNPKVLHNLAEAKLLFVMDRYSEYYSEKADLLFDFAFSEVTLHFEPIMLSTFMEVIFQFINLIESLAYRSLYFRPYKQDESKGVDLDHNRDFLRIGASLHKGCVTLIENAEPFGTATMTNTQILFTYTPELVHVNAKVGNLKMKETNSNTLYRRVVGVAVQEGSLIEINYDYDMTAESPEAPFYCHKLQAKMNSIQFVYLQGLVSKLITYFLYSPLWDAIINLVAERKQILSQSKQPLPPYTGGAQLVSLDILLVNPVIIMPVSHLSKDKLIGNLGDIRVSNRIFKRNYKDDQDKHAWLENIIVSMSSMHLQSELNGVVTKVLNDVDFSVLVDRPVTDPLQQLPITYVRVHVKKTLTLNLSQMQYQMIFRITSENFGDNSYAPQKKVEELTNAVKSSIIESIEPKNAPAVEEARGDQPYVKVEVFFHNFNYTISKNGSFDSDRPVPIGQMEAHQFRVKFNMTQDGKSETTVSVAAVDAFDMRENSMSKFKQFFDTKDQHDTKKFVKVVVDVQPKRQTMHIDVNIGSPKAIIDPMLIQEIVTYFSNTGYTATTTTAAPPIQTNEDMIVTHNIFLGNDIRLNRNKKLLVMGNATGEIVINGQGHCIDFDTMDLTSQEPLLYVSSGMTLRFVDTIIRYSDPPATLVSLAPDSKLTTSVSDGVISQVISKEEHRMLLTNTLVASPENEEGYRILFKGQFGHPQVLFPVFPEREDSTLVVVQGSVVFNMDMRPRDKETIYEAFVSDLTIFTQSQDQKSFPILEPIHLAFKMVEDYSQKSETIRRVSSNIKGKVRTRISYNNIRMIMKIVNSFSAQPESKDDFLKKALTSDDDLVVVSPLAEQDDEEFEEVRTPTAATIPHDRQSVEIQKSDSASNQAVSGVPVQYTFDINDGQEVSLLLIDDLNGYDVPLMNFGIDNLVFKEGTMKFGDTMIIHTSVNFRIAANFFNLHLATWEPIIEPYHFAVQYERMPVDNPFSPVAFTDKVTIARDDAGTKHDLNVNISRSMLEVVSRTQTAWTQEFNSDIISVHRDPYLLRNHSGFEIYFFKETDPRDQVTLSNFEESGFSFEEEDRFDLLQQDSMNIILDIPAIRIKQKVDVRKQGLTYFSHQEKKLVGVIEIEIEQGRKIITVRSGLKVHNNSCQEWLVGSVDRTSHVVTQIAQLKPNETIGVPATVINNGRLAIKPVSEGRYEWGTGEETSWINLMLQYKESKQIRCSYEGNAQKFQDSYAVVRTQFLKPIPEKIADVLNPLSAYLLQEYSGCISIEAPLVIENLLGRSIKFNLYQKVEDVMKKQYEGSLAIGAREYVNSLNIREDVYMTIVPNDTWKCERPALLFSRNSPAETSIDLIDNLGNQLRLYLDYNSTSEAHAFCHATIYSQFWIINHTKHELTAKSTSGQTIAQSEADRGKVKPMLLSLPAAQKDQRISIQLENSEFSKFINIGNVGVTDNFVVSSDNTLFPIGMNVALGPGKFSRTKVVTFSARIMLNNKTTSSIAIRQVNATEQVKIIAPSERLCYFWQGTKEKPGVQITIPNQGLDWSNPFKVDHLGEMAIRLNESDASERGIVRGKILRITIKEQKGSVIISIDEPKQAPYILENRIDSAIQFCQKDSNKWWTLDAQSDLPYSWDNDKLEQRLVFNINGLLSEPVDVNMITGIDNILETSAGKYYFSVQAAGLTRILRIDQQGFYRTAKHLKVSSNLEKRRIKDKWRNTRQDLQRAFSLNRSVEAIPENYDIDYVQKAKDEEFQLFVTMELPGMGVSLIDDRKTREVAFVHLDRMNLRYETTNKNEFIEFKIQSIQIDNQIRKCMFPVVFHSHSDEEKNLPVLHFSVCRSTESNVDQNVYVYKYLSAALQKVDLKIEYAFIETLMDLISSLTSIDDEKESKSAKDMIKIFEDEITEDSYEDPVRYYFDKLELHPISLSLTFLFNRAEEESNHSVPQKNRLLALVNNVGVSFAKIDEAPISLGAFLLEHPFLTLSEILEKLQKHYIRQVTYETYKILGSLDLIGNPIGLFNDIGTGFKDMFYDPAEAIVRRPEEFTQELTEGSISLFSKSVHGACNTASKITGTIGRGVDFLTFDQEYIHDREQESILRKPKNPNEGLVEGANSLARGFVEGATGVFTQPVHGAKKSGVTGFVKGMGKGIVGLPTKPVSGIIDFATKTNQGLSAIGRTEVTRVRFPRTFRKDGAVIPYYAPSAFSHHILYKVAEAQYYNQGERPVIHLPNDDRTMLYMITNKALLKIQLRDNELIWRFPLYTIVTAEMKDSHITVTAPDLAKKHLRGIFKRNKSNLLCKSIQNSDHGQCHRFYEALVKCVQQDKQETIHEQEQPTAAKKKRFSFRS